MRFPVFRPSVGTLVAVLVAVLSGPAFGEDATKAHVAVVLFANGTNSSSYDAACKAATDTLVMTLNELGRYRVQSEGSSGSGEEALRAMAEEQHLDFVMYGKMSKSGSGGIDCVLSVFDRAKGKTTLSQSRKAAGVLDIFDATDDLVVAVLESMTGAHIGFGSLALANTGEKGSYTVLVDGTAVGKDLESLDRVLNGKRKVTIAQKRMLGDREIASSIVDVKEGVAAELKFAVPYLMDDEKAKVESLRAAIGAGWDDASAAGELDAKTAEFASLFGDLSYSPRLSTYKDEATQLAGEWALRKNRLAIDDAAWEPKVELLDGAGTVYAGAKAYPDQARIRKAFAENAQFTATLFELEAGKALGDGDIDKGLESFEDALMLSTRYLGGARLADYAYAVTTLRDLHDKEGTQGAGAKDDKDLKTVFGPLMLAGRRFFDLKENVESGRACALVASDFGTKLSVDGGEMTDAPFAVQPASSSRTVSVQPKGEGKPITLTFPAKGKILFVEDGFASFGKIAIGYIPGSIQVNVDQNGAVASLDGDDGVDVPHLFENVVPGDHKISIRDLRVGDKFYAGIEESVSVEAGKRVKFHPELSVGKAKLRIEDIPTGSTLLIDGEEQTLAEDREGGMVFDGTVEAGFLTVQITQGNKVWDASPIVRPNVSEIRSVKSMNMNYALDNERRSIKLKGKAEDWSGIDPIFTASGQIDNPKISGSQISGGCLCRDANYLYIKIDSSDGKPGWIPNCNRRLILTQNGRALEFGLAMGGDEALRPFIWDRNHQINHDVWGSYREGSSFLEMQFPLSSISQFFDVSKPIKTSLGFWTKMGVDDNETPAVNILIGK